MVADLMHLEDVIKKPDSKSEMWIRILISAVALTLLVFYNVTFFSLDPFRTMSDAASHVIRAQFYLKDPVMVDEWYNGVPFFPYYPPLSIWLLTALSLPFGAAMAYKIMMVLTQLLIVILVIKLAKLLGHDWKMGLTSALILLGTYTVFWRFFNMWRVPDFMGFAFLLGWVTFVYSYIRKPSREALAAAFLFCFLGMITHVLAAISLTIGFLFLGAAYIVKRNNKYENPLMVTAAAGLPAILVYLPILRISNRGTVTAPLTDGYLFFIRDNLILLGSLFLSLKNRSWLGYLVLAFLVIYSFDKVSEIPPMYDDDFNGLMMNGTYVIVDHISTPLYSYLALKGYRSSWGYYEVLAPPELQEAYYSMNQTDCASIRAYAKATYTGYIIANRTDFSRCGFELIYKNRMSAYKIT